MTVLRITLDHPLLAGRTGCGVSVAVIDSGVHAGNPHITRVVRAVRVSAEGFEDDGVDRLGHGTAVAAAILEKAPDVELTAVRVFDHALSTSAPILSRAIEWAAQHGCRLINLSLGTAKQEREGLLRAAVERAAHHGALVVSARELDGVRWLPGSLPSVAGVRLDSDCERDELRVAFEPAVAPDVEPALTFLASGHPRPIPGVPPERNLRGISFAVANTTGFLARLCEAYRHTCNMHDLRRILMEAARDQAPPVTL